MRFGRDCDWIERIKSKIKSDCINPRFPDRPSSCWPAQSLPSRPLTRAFPPPVPWDIVFINGTRLEHAG